MIILKSLIYLFLSSSFIKNNNIYTNMISNDYYNFDEMLDFKDNILIYEFDKIDNNYTKQDNDTRFLDTDYNEFNITKLAMKYGAYNRHLKPRDDLPEKSRKPKRKRKRRKNKLNPRQFIRDLKKTGNIEKDDKPLIFVVSPEQMMIYKAYNKSMTESKIERDSHRNDTNKLPHSRKNNESLPKDWNNEEYYF